MKFISTKAHGVIDYATAILLIVSPWLFNFSDVQVAKRVVIVVGVLIILMSAFTNYEAGLIKRIPMRDHLYLHAVIGLFLIISPWLFTFSERVHLPQVIIGILGLVVPLLTRHSTLEAIHRRQLKHVH